MPKTAVAMTTSSPGYRPSEPGGASRRPAASPPRLVRGSGGSPRLPRRPPQDVKFTAEYLHLPQGGREVLPRPLGFAQLLAQPPLTPSLRFEVRRGRLPDRPRHRSSDPFPELVDE